MSHIVTIHAELRDPAALTAACRRLSLPEPVAGTATLFEAEAAGLLVHLHGWLYPVVVQSETGGVAFDNFNGAWGDRGRLDRLVQAYAVEKATLEARRRGHSVAEHRLADGSIRLTIAVGGAA